MEREWEVGSGGREVGGWWVGGVSSEKQRPSVRRVSPESNSSVEEEE